MTTTKERIDEHVRRLKQTPHQSTYEQFSEYGKKDSAIEDEHDRMVRFLCTVGQLKTLDRTGWILESRAIQKAESVAGIDLFIYIYIVLNLYIKDTCIVWASLLCFLMMRMKMIMRIII